LKKYKNIGYISRVQIESISPQNEASFQENFEEIDEKEKRERV
jgi:hypothetical protein